MSTTSSSSLRMILCARIPRFLNPKIHLFRPFPLKSPNLSLLLRPCSIQRIPTTPSSSPSPPPPSSSSLQPIEELPPKLQQIVKLFQSVPDSKAKYDQLLYYAKTLPPLDAQYKTDDYKVQGCVSQVWVRAYLDEEDKSVFFEADSDSVLTKGLAALLVQGLSGRPVDEILRVSPDFVVLLGLQQSLTPSRNNGFLNMLKLMQKKALQVYVQGDKATVTLETGNGLLNSVSNKIVAPESSPKEVVVQSQVDSGESVALGTRGERIKAVLTRELTPAMLEIEDVSYQHAGHAGVRGGGADGETHFNVKIVSDKFDGKSLVKRHRSIYELLQEELLSGLHALSIEAKTPSEVI